MPGLLKTVPVRDEERRAHDRHRPAVVLLVLAVLALYVYLFSELTLLVDLPRPVELAERAGLQLDHVFDPEDGIVEWKRYISLHAHDRDGPNFLAFYLVVAAAFLAAYFLPLASKQPALTACSVIAVALLYGPRATAALLLAHVLTYQTLHPSSRPRPSVVAGVLAAAAFGTRSAPLWWPVWGIVLPVLWAQVYRRVVLPLLARPRAGAVLRALAAHAALVLVCGAALVEGASGAVWTIPAGLVLFFWQWTRVILYHVDLVDGLVPRDLSLGAYLAVFLTPGAIPYWEWGGQTGQGYAYTQHNFLCEEKNRIVLGGVKLLLVAAGYLVLWNWLHHHAVALLESLGVAVHGARTPRLVRHFMAGGEVGTLSVLATTLLDLLRWLVIFGGMVHFKVGIWRICGYRIDPYFDKPWLATNLVSFWSRFTFHYREFLVRVFYYPVFFRFLRHRPRLRIVAATFAAAAAGNMIWGHLAERMFGFRPMFENFTQVASTWPYFVLLAGGISVAELHLLRTRRKRRRPWTPGPRLVLDVVAAYVTMQFYAMIHIFTWPIAGSTLWDRTRLFLVGLGLAA